MQKKLREAIDQVCKQFATDLEKAVLRWINVDVLGLGEPSQKTSSKKSKKKNRKKGAPTTPVQVTDKPGAFIFEEPAGSFNLSNAHGTVLATRRRRRDLRGIAKKRGYVLWDEKGTKRS